MNLTPEQQKELASFPAILRALIEAELAAGNSIVELGHSHPAPPAGAYLKLAQKVNTRPRSSDEAVDFYERNGSSHSGEFTDAKRFYFVLEPPNPPPPEEDMDAIRKSLEPKPAPVVKVARPRGEAKTKRVKGSTSAIKKTASPARSGRQAPRPSQSTPPRNVAIDPQSATGLTHFLHFRDPRPPHEVQFALERELATRFVSAMELDRLRWQATTEFNGVTYHAELRFEAALPEENRYSIRIEAVWPDAHPAVITHYKRVSAGWTKRWTCHLTPAEPPPADLGDAELYRTLSQSARETAPPPESVVAVQQTILALLKRGGRYGTSHKEGGTDIFWQIDRFVRSDYGDCPDKKSYPDETEFLRVLWQFCQFEVSRQTGNTALSELDTWKRILRIMRPE